jgi:Fe2+ transport system protein FeoA
VDAGESVLSCTLCLHQLAPGKCGRVVSVGGDPSLRRRLLEMGLCTGTPVQFIRKSPLGDPLQFRLRGYHLSLRAEQARHVTVELDQAPVAAPG